MKVRIVTFQFAHNYGAMLQAYALREYIEGLGQQVEIAPYIPEWADKEYTINPFSNGIPFRKRVRLLLQYNKRKKTANKFEIFQKENLNLHGNIRTIEKLESYLNEADVVFFGSDQIWNSEITGDSSAYYGGNITSKRISYAASLGTKTLSDVQKKNVKTYLPKFKKISVRENESAGLLKKYLNEDVSIVCDPVFLIKQEDWTTLCSRPEEIKEANFMVLYFLKEDMRLYKYAKEYANNNNLIIYEIHPTLAKFHRGTKHLVDIGPREFLWLIKNADCICSNSFHATSFSVIFKKKLLHIPNCASPGRTKSLFNTLGIELIDSNKMPLYDFETQDEKRLNEYIIESSDFLKSSLT